MPCQRSLTVPSTCQSYVPARRWIRRPDIGTCSAIVLGNEPAGILPLALCFFLILIEAGACKSFSRETNQVGCQEIFAEFKFATITNRWQQTRREFACNHVTARTVRRTHRVLKLNIFLICHAPSDTKHS